jgi:hypothetical protein
MLNYISIILGYAFLGGGLKYIDQAYDENAFSKFSAKILAVLLGFAMAYLMAVDTPFSTVFFAGLIAGVFVASKVDNKAFIIGVCCVIAFIGILSFFYTIQFSVLPFVFFFIATFLDEICDAIAHKKKFNKHLRKLLLLRPLSDITLFGLILYGFFSWFYLIPYYAFFISYNAVEKLSLGWLHNG